MPFQVMERIFLFLGSILGGLSVAMGAFGAHSMKGRYSDYAMEIFEKAVKYQMYHALALLVVSFLLLQRGGESRCLRISPWFFLAGILFFSGSLYFITFTGQRWAGMITPIGGVSFLVAWGLLACGALKINAGN